MGWNKWVPTKLNTFANKALYKAVEGILPQWCKIQKTPSFDCGRLVDFQWSGRMFCKLGVPGTIIRCLVNPFSIPPIVHSNRHTTSTLPPKVIFRGVRIVPLSWTGEGSIEIPA